MPVGVGKIAIRLPGIRTLKDKRNYLRRVFAFLKKNFELSLVEVPFDDPSTSIIEFARVTNSQVVANNIINKAIDTLEDNFDCIVISREISVLEV